MFLCSPQFWGNLRQNRYVIIILKTTNTIAIWSGVLLHTQNNIFYTEPENRNKHLPGWSLLLSVWRNLNNYILQQNILVPGKLFTKICCRAHEKKWSQGLPSQNFSYCYSRETPVLQPTKKPSQLLHSPTVSRNDEKNAATFLLNRECTSTLLTVLYKAFCVGSLHIWKALLGCFSNISWG